MTKAEVEVEVEKTEDLMKKRRAEVKLLAAAQGIKVDDDLLAKSQKEIEELESLAKGVKWAAENPDIFTDPLRAIGSMFQGVSLTNVAGALTTITGSVNLFDEYIVNVARKSYDNLMKIKHDPESTNFNFFKGCVQCAADMFFGIKAFRKKAQEKHPGLIAVEVLFAKQLAPVYAVAALFSTILDLCDFKDNTAELIKGGKELKEEAEKAKKAFKEIEQEQGVSMKDFTKACDVLNEAGIFDAVVAVAAKAKTIEDIADDLKGLAGAPKERVTEFIQKMAEVVAELPKSKDDVAEFIARMMPGAEGLPEKQKVALEALEAGLMEIKDGTPPVERITSTAMALQKFTRNFERAGGEVAEPLKQLADKIATACDPLVKKDRATAGGAVEKVATAVGCGKAFVFAVTEFAKGFKQAPAVAVGRG